MRVVAKKFVVAGWMGIIASLGLMACDKSKAESPAPVAAPVAATSGETPTAAAPKGAVVGQAAPDFTLKDVNGATVSLSQFKGKTVVLEWFNPDCPFVVRTHNEGPLKTMAADVAKNGVVWLAINSGAAGKQGAGAERNKSAIAEYNLAHPVLLDENGAVGKLYQAANTPGMYVVDAKGTLVYAGAIDNAPKGTPPEEGYRNHVAEALTDVAAAKAVRVAETKQYGCSVKYAD